MLKTNQSMYIYVAVVYFITVTFVTKFKYTLVDNMGDTDIFDLHVSTVKSKLKINAGQNERTIKNRPPSDTGIITCRTHK